MSAATVAAIAKAAVAVLSNEKTRKALGWVIVAILSPLIVLVVLICAVLSGSSQHNVSAVELCFHGGTISSSATPEYRGYIEDMRGSFAQLDRAIEEINAQCEDGNSLDDTRVKAVFYALYFAAEHPDDSGIRAFTDCFVDYEERTRTVTTTDEEGNEVEVEETYTVAIPVTDMNEVYARIEAAMGITVTPENQSNADSIYNIVLYGTATGTGDWFPGADVPFISVDGFCSPVGANWESIVTSEFGYRRDPFSTPRLRRRKAAQAAEQATKQALTAAALSWILPGSRQAACRESPRRAPELDAAAPLCHPPPLKQELHKRLPGTFQKVLTDKHAASVRHAEGGAFQILRVFQIYDHAAPAHKKAGVIL